MDPFVRHEHVGHTLWLILNRPDSMNALSVPLMRELRRGIQAGSTDPDVHSLVITGAGRAFCAGADLAEAKERVQTPRLFQSGLHEWLDTFGQIEACPKPVIAAVNGVALAGGIELALACDVIVASSGAKLGDVHARYGLVPGGGGSQRLPNAVGTRWARWLMYTGDIIDAQQALAIGLVQAVLPQEDFREQLQSHTDQMNQRSRPSLALMKRLTAPDIRDFDLHAEIDAAVLLLTGPDAQEGLRSFEEKREPQFTDRLDLPATPS